LPHPPAPPLAGLSWSFLFVCEDISGEADARGRREDQLRGASRMRAPLTSLAQRRQSRDASDWTRPAGLRSSTRSWRTPARWSGSSRSWPARSRRWSRPATSSGRLRRGSGGLGGPAARGAGGDPAHHDRRAAVGEADVQALLFCWSSSPGDPPPQRRGGARVETLLGDRRVYFNYCWRGGVVPQARSCSGPPARGALAATRSPKPGASRQRRLEPAARDAGLLHAALPRPLLVQSVGLPAPASPPVRSTSTSGARGNRAGAGWEQLRWSASTSSCSTRRPRSGPLQATRSSRWPRSGSSTGESSSGRPSIGSSTPGGPSRNPRCFFTGSRTRRSRAAPHRGDAARFREFVGMRAGGHNGRSTCGSSASRSGEPGAFRGPVLDTLASRASCTPTRHALPGRRGSARRRRRPRPPHGARRRADHGTVC